MSVTMRPKEELCREIWKEDAEEVLEFLNTVTPEKETFRNEKSLLNHLGRCLERKINKAKATIKEPWPGYWDNRKIAVKYEWQHNKRPTNILNVIRLLNEKVPS